MFDQSEQSEMYRASKLNVYQQAVLFLAATYYLSQDESRRAWTDLVAAGKLSAAIYGTPEQWDAVEGGALKTAVRDGSIPKHRIRRVHIGWFLVLIIAVAFVIAYYELTFINTYR